MSSRSDKPAATTRHPVVYYRNQWLGFFGSVGEFAAGAGFMAIAGIQLHDMTPPKHLSEVTLTFTSYIIIIIAASLKVISGVTGMAALSRNIHVLQTAVAMSVFTVAMDLIATIVIGVAGEDMVLYIAIIFVVNILFASFVIYGYGQIQYEMLEKGDVPVTLLLAEGDAGLINPGDARVEQQDDDDDVPLLLEGNNAY